MIEKILTVRPRVALVVRIRDHADDGVDGVPFGELVLLGALLVVVVVKDTLRSVQLRAWTRGANISHLLPLGVVLALLIPKVPDDQIRRIELEAHDRRRGLAMLLDRPVARKVPVGRSVEAPTFGKGGEVASLAAVHIEDPGLDRADAGCAAAVVNGHEVVGFHGVG